MRSAVTPCACRSTGSAAVSTFFTGSATEAINLAIHGRSFRQISVSALEHAAVLDAAAASAAQRLDFCDGLIPTMTSSMHHDLQRGSRLELRWLGGDVVARGERLGIATPNNRAVLDILSVHADGPPA